MPNTIPADQVIGKTLSVRAGAIVKVKSLPLDGQPTLYTISGGNPIGVVFSWVNPAEGRKNLWWQVERPEGGYVWVEHLSGVFDVNKLEQQGITTLEDQAWQDKPLLQKVLTVSAYVLGGYAVIKLAQMNKGNWQ